MVFDCLFSKDCKTSKMVKPYLDVKAYSTLWRCINLAMATSFLLAAAVQLKEDDWWLWMPFYVAACLFSASIVLNPKSVDDRLWRLVCASTIVFGLLNLIYTFWVVRDVIASSYVRNPFELDGRECAGLAVAIIWAIICRMTASNRESVLRQIRLLFLGVILMGCVFILAWSACFFEAGFGSLPYCKRMFITGDNDM